MATLGNFCPNGQHVGFSLVRSDSMGGVRLGQLLLALDATLVSLVEAPRGLDLPVASAALLDRDDIQLGVAPAFGSADIFFLLGIDHPDTMRWLDQHGRSPVAIFAKHPSPEVIRRATRAGVAVVAVEPRARWERLYRLVDHVFDHHGAGSAHDSGTDLFGLAQSIAERTRGMVSIEDAESHVLAYSASNEEADELRRLSILGRAGPPEHLAWIARRGIFDALHARPDPVRVAERPELGLRPRLAIGIFGVTGDARRAPAFLGTIWLQQGDRPLAEDTEEVLRGAAVLAGRLITRLATKPSGQSVLVQDLLGLTGDPADIEAISRELGVPANGRAAVIGIDSDTEGTRLSDVVALSANAFRPDAQVTAAGGRVYVLFPDAGKGLPSWVRSTVSSLRTELGLELRAVTAAQLDGLAGAATARAEVDRVLDSAARRPGSLAPITSPAEARTTVLLDEIVTLITADERLVDPRIKALRADEPVLAHTLTVYLDSFGDIASAAAALHVHPNTVRYRVRRIEGILGASLADPDVRLLMTLSLRATA